MSAISEAYYEAYNSLRTAYKLNERSENMIKITEMIERMKNE